MNDLAIRLAREIRATGPLPFARFMEASLYCPDLGYYERISTTPGRRGDFYTSVSVGPLFGELLAFQFDLWTAETGAGPLQLIEAGAQDGRLARDILTWSEHRRPAGRQQLEYWILEPSSRRRGWQQTTLGPLASRVRWLRGWDEVPTASVRGVIFSNELLDAFPVHRCGWDAAARTWYEWGVDYGEGGFGWVRLHGPTSVPAELLPVVPVELEGVLPEGYTVEIAPAAVAWWRAAAASLRRGRLMTFDYGFGAERWLLPWRFGGTLRAYRRHQEAADPLARPGEQDLTAHVNWTHVRCAGEAEGLTTEVWEPQRRFLTELAARAWQAESRFGEWTAARTRQFQTLTHPAHLGQAFQVLVQKRE